MIHTRPQRIHAVEKVQALLHEDPKLKKTVDTLTQEITL